MVVDVKGRLVRVDEEAFLNLPIKWIFGLEGEELKRMAILKWRFTFYADKAVKEYGEQYDCSEVMYESQKSLCLLFGMSENSRTKASLFLSKMEKLGFLKVKRSKFPVEGKMKPRHFLVPADPAIFQKYNLAATQVW